MNIPAVSVIRMAVGALTSAAFMMSPPAFSHGTAMHGKKADAPLSAEEHAFGKQGEPRHAVRTIIIDMNDTMRFSPDIVRIKQGETVKFLLKNKGKTLHEMVIGTMAELKEHGELMKKFPNMEHDEPYMTHVAPGAQENLVWQFTKAGQFNYGCLIPGHFDAGMVGKIIVTKE